jgi:glucosyl-dolichyl phosphate glucuronosyltransferase
MPWNLIKCRGDGESGIIKKVISNEYKVVYTPFAVVTHVIPKEMLTLQYFKKKGLHSRYKRLIYANS